jgi:hypothetical protein
MTTKLQQRLDRLIAQGFDAASVVRGGMIRPKCSQCEALVIQGVACHETGCPHETRECHGCNALIPVRQRYCGECS